MEAPKSSEAERSSNSAANDDPSPLPQELADVSLKMPPRYLGFGSSISEKSSPQSPSVTNGGSLMGGFLRALSFKKKTAAPDGEQSSLIRPDSQPSLQRPLLGEKSSLIRPDSQPALRRPLLANPVSRVIWKRCTSLPARAASKSSPSASAPAFARTSDEWQKSQCLAGLCGACLAIKQYIWAYAALEFALVAMILCLFYSVLHLPPIYSITLSSVLGFGAAMGLNFMYSRYYALRVQLSPSSSAV
nr:E3 ubiquitin-protein ligase MARCH7-like isoform X3 [Ipomoea batatas]